MNPELTYTLELARMLSRTIDGVSAAQERVGLHLAFDRALKRGHEAIIAMLNKACVELVGIEGEEIGRFLRSLEYGEIPKGEFFTAENSDLAEPEDLSGRNGTDRRRNNGDPIIEGARKDAAQNKRGRGVGARSLSRREVVRSNRTARCKSFMDGRARAKAEASRLRGGSSKPARVSASARNGVTRPTSFEQKKGRNLSGKGTFDPVAAEATRDSVPLVPSDERSAQIMSQWRRE
jgi:hypothetical protein